jgi:chromosome segregation ATPase
MKPFKNLMGNNNAREQEQLEAVRGVLAEIQKERERYEALVEGAKAGADRLKKLGEPLAKTESDVDTLAARMAQMEERFESMVKLSSLFQNLDERAEGLAKSTQWAESRLATALEGSQKIEASMADLVAKVDLASELRERLTSFLEVEKPFQLLRRDAETLHGQLEGATERMARLREQHDRLLDANKMATTKLEAMDRRRDELGRSLQDKERRVEGVELAVKSLDGVETHINTVKREMVTLKALGDTVTQKTAALEAHREALDRALAQSDHLDRAMRNIDAGIRQQKENEKTLAALGEQVASLQALHDAVLERSNEVTQLQRQSHEQTLATRQDLAAMTEEMKNTVERFDFEARGLESVSQRVGDLRADVATCENRFKSLSEASLTMGDVKHQVDAVSAQVQAVSQEVGTLDREMSRIQALRRDLDHTGSLARDLGEQITRIENSRGAVEAGLRDLSQLAGAHALVHDALERIQVAQDEMTRVRQGQSDTRTWLDDTARGITELKARVATVHELEPKLQTVETAAKRINETSQAIESRRQFVDELHRRVTELGALSTRMDERGHQLAQRMDAAEERFTLLAEQATTAEQVARTLSSVTFGVEEASGEVRELKQAVSALSERCESVEVLAGETQALRKEVEQRARAVKDAAKDLENASALRQGAADAAAQMGELAKQLTAAIDTADRRAQEVSEISRVLEDRAQNLRGVGSRLDTFEARMSKWDVTEQEILRSLELIASRQGTIESLQGDLERMFDMAEKTSVHVREITSAHQQLEEDRAMLKDVLGQLKQLRETRGKLDERKRQLTQAEERLSKAEALLVDVQSSLSVLEGQKSLVDQAVEKAGMLQSLLRQAEASIGNMREASRTMGRPKSGKIVALPRPESGAPEGDSEGDDRPAQAV